MDPKTFENLLNDAETRLDRLRALYEQWFQGLERLEPTIPRKNFDRFMEQLRRDKPRVTGLKFRYQNLVSRYTTYVVYWRKVARQIEEGTYRRDVLRARQVREEAREKYRQERDGKKAEKERATGDGEASAEAASQVAEQPASGRPAAAAALAPAAPGAAATPAPVAAKPPPRPTSAQRPSGPSAATPASPRPPRPSPAPVASQPAASSGPAAPAPAPGGLSEQQLRSIYDRYVAAKTRNNESADINYEKLAGKVAAMIPELQKKHAGKRIDFEVVVRDGRVALKPVVK